MGFFVKALAAIVAADAIDRHVRSRPTRYWYPSESSLPQPGSQTPYLKVALAPAAPSRPAPPVGWDLEHPERPSLGPKHR